MEAYNPHHHHYHQQSLDVDVNRMFDQYLYKGIGEENLDVSLSVPQYNSPQTMLHPQQQQQQQQHHGAGGLSNGSHHTTFDMNDQTTFHTSSYGGGVPDDDFDISSLNPAAPQATQQPTNQMSHAHVGGHLNHGQQQQQQQQQNTYQMHHHATPPHHYNQWHPEQQQQQQSHMSHSQNYQMPPQQQQQQQGGAPPSSYGMTSPAHQQMLMPQMSPQISSHNNYNMGRSPPQQQQQQQQQQGIGGGAAAPGHQQQLNGPSDDSDDNGLINPLKRQSPDLSGDSTNSPTGGSGSTNGPTGTYMKSGPSATGAPSNKKPKVQKKKKKRDPNEPQKPVSAYALFFRDTQAAIKGQNPNASFGEVSKIVASMWDVLATEHKNVYKKKTEAAKKEYLKALAAYRASLVSKGSDSESPQSAIYASPVPGQMQSPPEPNSPQGGPGIQQQQQQQQQPPPHHAQQGQQQMPGISPHRQQQQQQQQSYHHSHHQMSSQEATSQGYPPNYKSPQPHHTQMMPMMTSHMGQQIPAQHQHHNMHLSQMQHMQHPQQMGAHLMGGGIHEAQNMPHYVNPQLTHQQQQQASVSQQSMGHLHQSPHHHMLHSSPSMGPTSHSGGAEGQQGTVPQQQPQGQMAVNMSGGQMVPGQQQMMMNGAGGVGGGAGGGGNDGHSMSPNVPVGVGEQTPLMCIREGCPNQAVSNSDWEDEYCSNECVISHCRDVFGNWVQNNAVHGQQTNPYPSVVK